MKHEKISISSGTLQLFHMFADTFPILRTFSIGVLFSAHSHLHSQRHFAFLLSTC